MPLIVPPGYVLASFVFSGSVGTAPYVTTCGFDSSAWGGDFVGLANTLMTDYARNLENRTNNDLTLDRVTVFVGSDGSSGSVDSNIPAIPMKSTAETAPTSMSLIARKGTNDLGRRGRGRMFLPGSCPEAQITESGGVTTSYLNLIQPQLDQLLEDWTEGVAGEPLRPPVLLHGSAPADPTPITSLTVAPLVGWIRGRIR